MSLSVELKAKVADLIMEVKQDIKELDLVFKEKKFDYVTERKALVAKLNKLEESYYNGAVQPDMFLGEI